MTIKFSQKEKWFAVSGIIDHIDHILLQYQDSPMPFYQPGNYANANFGTYYDIAGNMINNYPTDGAI